MKIRPMLLDLDQNQLMHCEFDAEQGDREGERLAARPRSQPAHAMRVRR